MEVLALEVPQAADTTGDVVAQRFQQFLETFAPDDLDELDALANNDSPYGNAFYLNQIQELLVRERSTLVVDFDHVIRYEEAFADLIRNEYYRFEPFLRQALLAQVRRIQANAAGPMIDEKKQYYLSFYNMPMVHKIRQLNTANLGRLISITGTVTRTSDVRPELISATFICLECGHRSDEIEQQFKFTEPIKCKNDSCTNMRRWQLDASAAKFVDWQKVKVQEGSQDIPSGSMPRTVDVILRHETVEQAKPGDRALFTGSLLVLPDTMSASSSSAFNHTSITTSEPAAEGVRGFRELGAARDLTYRMCFIACSVVQADAIGGMSIRGDDDDESSESVESRFTPEELDEIRRMQHQRDLYNNLVKSIAPAVYGHNEVKKGILLMLFGGVHKQTRDRIHLRGDINICIVGDPSVAKSQFLKYVVSFLPRAVYTSGKASSAAGLTASVVRDADSGEFNIEAGALMLADNGICCIDEFDKMDPVDQVAIHEAMEQQTISIAKAGIQATFNARASILAAANPIGGRYDRSKTLKANLNITPAIMSRFDLFFVVLDTCDESADYNIASHIVRVHQKKDQALVPPFSMQAMQRYIRYARSIKPVITPEAQQLLVTEYRKLRQKDVGGAGKTAYRITVRQLESMIRLSEALARLHLSPKVLPRFVQEAARLLQTSIIEVEAPDILLSFDSHAANQRLDDLDDDAELQRAEGGDGGDGQYGAASAMDVAASETEEADADADHHQERRTKRQNGAGRHSTMLEPIEGPPVAHGERAKDEDETTARPRERAQRKKKTTVAMTYERYQQLKSLVIMHLNAVDPEGFGVTQAELVKWLLKETIEDGSDKLAEAKLLSSLVNRLLAGGDVLVELDAGDSMAKRRLALHPNVDTEL